jgi:hypothetical protein
MFPCCTAFYSYHGAVESERKRTMESIATQKCTDVCLSASVMPHGAKYGFHFNVGMHIVCHHSRTPNASEAQVHLYDIDTV